MLNNREKTLGAVILASIVGLFLLIALFMSVFTVQSGTRKIVMTAGEATSVASEGINFKIPFYQKAKEVDIKTLKVSQKANAASRDMQTVTSTISVNYHYDSSKLIEINKSTGFDIGDTIIAPRIQETLKSVAAKYSAEELITQRERAKNDIDAILKRDLSKYNIVVEDIQLTEFNFSDEYNKAIESKQTEAQKTLKSLNTYERIKVEAKSRVAQAEGEAEAIRTQTEAIREAGGEEYIQLKWIEKWNGQTPTFVSGESSGVMLNMQTGK